MDELFHRGYRGSVAEWPSGTPSRRDQPIENAVANETVLTLARCSHWSVILMAHYFFHLKVGASLIEDEEGSELDTAEEARAVAVKSLREIFAASIKAGADEPAIDGILIADKSGEELAFLPLAEVLPKWLRPK
jgi:hypothetical protein